MICEKCGREMVTLSRDIVMESQVAVLYYCWFCNKRVEVIETV